MTLIVHLTTLLLLPHSLSAEKPLVDTLIAERRWAEAAIVLKEKLEEEPKSHSVRMKLARALTYLGRREEAIRLLTEIPSLRGKVKVLSKVFLTNETFQTYLGGIHHLKTENYVDAKKALLSAHQTEAGNSEILLRLGQCYVLQRDFDSAAEKLRTAKRLNPSNPEISLWLGRALYHRGEIGQALKELAVAEKNFPESNFSRIWLAEVYISLGQKDQAINLLENSVKKYPFRINDLIALAKIRVNDFKVGYADLIRAKKDIQIAMSRMARYKEKMKTVRIAEKELVPTSAEAIEKQVGVILQQIELKLEKS